ncbi:MAG: NfeD family protein [Ruminococcaceae bacterium]|nr:NfeD family protein [Oscillospiraceae bacterium]
MLEYMPYIWAAVILIAIYVESITADLVTIWFIPAGILALVLSVLPFDIAVWVQVLVFFALALVLVTLSTTIFKKSLKRSPIVPTNLDLIIGKDAIVTETINNIEGKGAVKVGGKEWSAVTEDNSIIIEKNELVTVKQIRGVKLVCIKNNSDYSGGSEQ